MFPSLLYLIHFNHIFSAILVASLLYGILSIIRYISTPVKAANFSKMVYSFLLNAISIQFQFYIKLNI